MEIPYGHRIKIIKKIKEFKNHRSKKDNESSTNVEAMNTTFSEMGVGIGTDMNELEDNNKINNREAVEKFRKGKRPETNKTYNLDTKKISVIREVDEDVNEV